MNHKDAFYFVAQCLNINENNNLRIRERIYSGNVDWSKIVWTASNHLVFPSLYLKLRDLNLLSFIPLDLQTYLTDIYVLNKKRNCQILQQVKEINHLLLKNHIAPVFLKGTANLIDDLYSDVGERMIGDIDFLVPEKAFIKTIGLLKADGYSSSVKFYKNELVRMKHYPRLTKEGNLAAIEVHRKPVAFQYQKYLNGAMIFEQKSKAENLKAFVPSDKHKIVQNYIHGQLNDKAVVYGLVSLRNLYDLHLLQKREVDLSGLSPRMAKQVNSYIDIKNIILGRNIKVQKKLKTRFYIFRINLNLLNPKLAKINGLAIYSFSRLLRYFQLCINALFKKEFRNYINNRITDLNWYSLHFASYKKGLKKFI